MSKDNEAQKRRAERLREEVERLKRGAADEDSDKDVDTDPPRSPREFIEKRMHELDEETGDAQS